MSQNWVDDWRRNAAKKRSMKPMDHLELIKKMRNELEEAKENIDRIIERMERELFREQQRIEKATRSIGNAA